MAPDDTALSRLNALGYDLPEAKAGRDRYVPYRHAGSMIYVSGQLPYVGGELPTNGLLGRDVDVEEAQELAKIAVVNALAVASSAVDGGLGALRVVQMMVFVASTPDFAAQSTVADAASALLVDVLGENGEHARTAIGVAALPRNSPVEIQLVCTTVSPTAD